MGAVAVGGIHVAVVVGVHIVGLVAEAAYGAGVGGVALLRAGGQSHDAFVEAAVLRVGGAAVVVAGSNVLVIGGIVVAVGNVRVIRVAVGELVDGFAADPRITGVAVIAGGVARDKAGGGDRVVSADVRVVRGVHGAVSGLAKVAFLR